MVTVTAGIMAAAAMIAVIIAVAKGQIKTLSDNLIYPAKLHRLKKNSKFRLTEFRVFNLFILLFI